MEPLELEFNNYVTDIFVLVKRNNNYQYYFSNKEYWFMDSWQYLQNDAEDDFITIALNKVHKYKIDIVSIRNEYERLESQNMKFVMQTNLPMLFVNFDKNILKSRYHEQVLEDRIIEGWTGAYESFLKIVPNEYKYWNKELDHE